MTNAWKRLAVLAAISLTAACQTIQPTPIAATESRIAAGVCSVWLPITYSSRDTAETALQVRAGNAARDAYCQEAP